MKKIILTTILCSAVLITAGCTKTNDVTSADKSNISSNVETNASANNVPQYIKLNADYYANGIIYGNETATFLDFDTMEKVPLCAVPNCVHNNAGCLSRIVGNVPVIYNDNIYYFSAKSDINETTDGRHFFIDSKLMKASLDSSETEIVSEFTDCVPVELDGYLLNGNELYFTGDNMNPQEDEYGNINNSSTGGIHYLCSINLDTGKYTNYGSIYDGDKEYDAASRSSSAHIAGYYNKKMYIQYSFLKEDTVIDPAYADVDLREQFTILNFEFDLKTKELTESQLPPPSYMDEDSYVYYDMQKKQSIVLSGKETYTIDCDANLNARIFNGKLFVPYERKWYDLSDKSEHSMGKYEDYDVIAYYNNCYILLNGGKTIKLTEEELSAL